jgi:hypothetical protein
MEAKARRRSQLCMLASALLAGSAAAWGTPVAFPGADGFGANALGGRGGAVYHVTNLTDNATTPAAGSFRGVLTQIASDEKNGVITGATVVFDVGGTIPLTNDLSIKNVNNITIAGQTAPGPGINLVGYKFDVTSSNGTKATDPTTNIIVRYIADRRGNTISSANDDAMGVLGSTSDQNHNTHDVIFDHVTAAWGMDEDLSVTDSATNVTIQNSFITEALQSGHQFGSLIRPRFGANVSYIGNLYANNQSRNPRPGSYNSSTLNFDFRDNTIYNWGDRAGYTGGASETGTETVMMNYSGNYLIAGPSTPSGFHATSAYIVDTSNTSGTKDNLNISVYQANNLVDANKNNVADGTDTGWNAFVRYNGTTATPFLGTNSAQVTTAELSSPLAFAVPNTATTDPTKAYQQTLASAGNMPWARNESDARIVNQVQNQGGAILLTAPTNEYNDLINQAQVSRPAGFDSDQDGMPDAWETQHGLNPNAADNNVVVTNAESSAMAGYTWLEMYLNDLTLQANWNGGASGSWDGILNWNGQLPNLQDSTANFGNAGGPAQVTDNSDEHVGQLSFDNPSGYTVTGTGDISLDVLVHNGAGFATVTVNSGNQTIGVPLNLLNDTHFSVAGGSLLDVTGALNAAGRLLNKDGAGDAQFGNVRSTGLTISQGNVRIRENGVPDAAGGISVLGSLNIAGSSAHLDLTNNALVLPYTSGGNSVAITTVRGLLLSTELESSVADASHRLGYIDNSVSQIHNLGGLDPGSNSVIVEFVYAGDTDFNGIVDDSDFQTFKANYGATGGDDWQQGDFDYNGTVDANDFRLLLAGMQASGQTPGQDVIDFGASIGVPVPEPIGGSVALVGAAGLLRRRRR